jgi:tRNA threonylcarbamoyl adenosine modification protein YeaZ
MAILDLPPTPAPTQSSNDNSWIVVPSPKVISRMDIDNHQDHGHGLELPTLTLKCLDAAGLQREQIEKIVVGFGPGSYTGIRAAIALAQGWSMALGIRLSGGSSMTSMALKLGENGLHGTVHLLLDAQRGEYYHGSYEVDRSPQGQPPGSMAIRCLTPLHIIAEPALVELINSGIPVYSPENLSRHPQIQRIYPDAAWLAAIACAMGVESKAEHLEPIYLRQTEYVKAAPSRRIL